MRKGKVTSLFLPLLPFTSLHTPYVWSVALPHSVPSVFTREHVMFVPDQRSGAECRTVRCRKHRPSVRVNTDSANEANSVSKILCPYIPIIPVHNYIFTRTFTDSFIHRVLHPQDREFPKSRVHRTLQSQKLIMPELHILIILCFPEPHIPRTSCSPEPCAPEKPIVPQP